MDPKTYTEEEMLIAFVQGAKWWEGVTTGATMWQEDQNDAYKEAQRKLADGKLGQPWTP